MQHIFCFSTYKINLNNIISLKVMQKDGLGEEEMMLVDREKSRY